MSKEPESSYQKVVLYYTTGTGNSFRAATWFAEAARAVGAEVAMASIEEANPPQQLAPGPGTLVGIFGPTHGFTAPWSLIRFVAGLPPGEGRHAFVSVTRAGSKLGPLFVPGLDGTATYLLAALLSLKGYRLRGAQPFDFPSNWMSLHPAYTAATIDAILARQHGRVNRFAARLLGGQRHFGGLIALLLGLLLVPMSLGYLLCARFFLGKLFFASERCNGCGLCAQSCARKAIRMVGERAPRPYWTYHCESCMRCMAYCPRRAVDASLPMGVLFFLVPASWPLHTWLAQWLSEQVPALTPLWQNELFWWLAWGLYFAAVAVALYAVQSLLLRFRAGNAFFAFTTPTRWYKRYHEPATPLRALAELRPPPGRKRRAASEQAQPERHVPGSTPAGPPPP